MKHKIVMLSWLSNGLRHSASRIDVWRDKYANRTTRTETPSGLDWPSGNGRQDSDGRDAGQHEIGSSAVRQGWREGAGGNVDAGTPVRDCQGGGWSEVGVMVYNALKAAQVVAYLTQKSPNKIIDVLKVIKLVYLADRESIKRFGFPILDEPRVSMPHGPVNSVTYSHIQGEYDLEACGWSLYLSDRANHQVSVQSDSPSGFDELSDADIQCLDNVWREFGHMQKWELRDWTHSPKNIPEWENPNGSSLPIPIERIMLALGIANGGEFADEIGSFHSIDRSFESVRT
jgi:uncharacterized phage-associated protein